jgi:cytochrome d ubiquinol oxidase subunit II
VNRTIASVLLAAIVAYSVLGGADFGTGLWDLTAGGAKRGAKARAFIDHAIGPVWEANHTWLIFTLVLAWTGFPTAFAAVMTTQYIPLGIAALGIVLRGSGFAFRKVAIRTVEQRFNSVAFAVSSLVTPFCFGAVAGGIASGRVPTQGHGDPLRSWLNPTSVVGGILAVATCGYLAAVFLTAQAQRLGEADLERWSRRRALIAAVAAGAVAVGGLFVIDHDAHRLYVRLIHDAWPCIAVSVVAGVLELLVTARRGALLVRVLGVLAVAPIGIGWGIAQYPYLLGTHLTINAAAAPSSTMNALAGVTVAAALLVGPSLALLFLLTDRGRLSSDSA